MSKNELQIIDNNKNLPIGSIDGYMQRVNHIPMLSAEEEYTLGKKLQTEGDLEAAQKLVTSHLRYVVRVAKGYLGYGLHLSDLIQEGTIGLMKAVKRFDPDKGVRLVSFAVHWIKAEIHEFIIRNWRIVKVATTKAQRKLFFNLRSSKKRLGWFTQEEVNSIAQELGVKPEEVVRMEQRMQCGDIAFDLPGEHDEYTIPAPIEYLESDERDPLLLLEQANWSNYTQNKVQEIISSLDQRSRDILDKRYMAEQQATLSELANKYKISAERVRQLEQSALNKIKQAIAVDEITAVEKNS
jgi:RNA polymerase sigma-32 factor